MREGANDVIKHMYLLDPRCGWGIHVIQELVSKRQMLNLIINIHHLSKLLKNPRSSKITSRLHRSPPELPRSNLAQATNLAATLDSLIW
ncbi:hypothetical protein CK203_030758 [Vitis vinifera]|uniref:Uncharacterized protein n=1 Tax=Vitis vinifera TaxID=29760 RepID=A0A438DX37_VITVI|nr:hypothetical protein CK203_081957 [Vitis vinifera]RVW99348.1 hypothetical protein CK203_030758 [Vitis vinifera]